MKALWICVAIVVGVLVLIPVLTVLALVLPMKEKFVSYSGFRAVNRRNKNYCKNYHLNLYRQCIRNSSY